MSRVSEKPSEAKSPLGRQTERAADGRASDLDMAHWLDLPRSQAPKRTEKSEGTRIKCDVYFCFFAS